jgi:hypothetical protein
MFQYHHLNNSPDFFKRFYFITNITNHEHNRRNASKLYKINVIKGKIMSNTLSQTEELTYGIRWKQNLYIINLNDKNSCIQHLQKAY